MIILFTGVLSRWLLEPTLCGKNFLEGNGNFDQTKFEKLRIDFEVLTDSVWERRKEFEGIVKCMKNDKVTDIDEIPAEV